MSVGFRCRLTRPTKNGQGIDIAILNEMWRCWLRVWILVSRKGEAARSWGFPPWATAVAKTHWGLSFKDSIWEFHTSIQQRLFLVVRASCPQELYKLNAQQLIPCGTEGIGGFRTLNFSLVHVCSELISLYRLYLRSKDTELYAYWVILWGTQI
jgi:hypothetical protein